MVKEGRSSLVSLSHQDGKFNGNLNVATRFQAGIAASIGRWIHRWFDKVKLYDVQQDDKHLIVAEIPSNRTRAADPANLLIEMATPEGQATG